MGKPIVIKKSPIVIVKNFIFLQIGSVAAFFIVAALANYAAIYRTLVISHFISFHVAESVFIFSAETAMVFFIFFRWYRESFQIRNGDIIHTRGILYRRKITTPLDYIGSVSHNQSPLGKLTKYGTIELTSSDTNKKIKLGDVPNPEEFVELILESKRIFASQNLKENLSIAAGIDIQDLLNKDEHERLEFKTTFRWDVKQNIVNKVLEKSVMKTIAAFLNSQGGHLVIGVSDNKSVVGLSADYGSLVRKDADGFENHFTQVFHNMIGAEFRQLVKLTWSEVNGKECCIVSVSPSQKPVYLKNDNDSEGFYIRTGNGTTALKLSETNDYINSRRNRF